jgi:hypothetical protein
MRMQSVRSLSIALLVSITPACAGGSGSDHAAAEAACREQGYFPATVGMAKCLDPARAESLEKATEAWDGLSKGE